MKKFLFINILSTIVFFAGGITAFAREASKPDADLRPQMEEHMEDKKENREMPMMEQGGDAEERHRKAEMRMEERYQEARARFQERRDAVLIQKEEVQDHVKARHAELSQQWQDHKAKLSERHKQNIKNHIERIIQRMEQAIERLGNMADKIEDRLSRLEKDGADVTALRSLLQEARSAVANADSTLDTVAVELRAAPDTDNPADALGKARTALEDVKAALHEAHAALVEVVVEIKKGQLVPDNE